MKSKAEHWAQRIDVDLDTCNSCKVCVDACFQDVFRWDAKENKPVAAYPEDCVTCYACEIACPVRAIEVVPTIPVPLHPSYQSV